VARLAVYASSQLGCALAGIGEGEKEEGVGLVGHWKMGSWGSIWAAASCWLGVDGGGEGV
jgi:hypothetical protein